MMDMNRPDFWDESYRSGRSAWDLGRPNPVFQRIAESRQFPPGRMLVLCAGRGHDARMFARHAFEVTAVDFAAEAVNAMKELANPEAPVEVLQADLFTLPPEWGGRFDYVLEYTCFSAIDPERRTEYLREVSRLLKPGGHYVALAFPIGKRPGGPPFTYQPDDLSGPLLASGFELVLHEVPLDSPPGRQGHEELLVLRSAQEREDKYDGIS